MVNDNQSEDIFLDVLKNLQEVTTLSNVRLFEIIYVLEKRIQDLEILVDILSEGDK